MPPLTAHPLNTVTIMVAKTKADVDAAVECIIASPSAANDIVDLLELVNTAQPGVRKAVIAGNHAS